MSWLGLARALVALALAIAEQVRNRGLVEAGRAAEVADSLKVAHDRIDEALAARRAARARDADPGRLRDDDG
ncbi:hypothetical protein, partial [uncultured Methylobacterium sp.]|uniref:hypothetical protein n=1 Tax=uncultured Methylobacterium sp. TaxID=157278 RepID=UPI0035CA2B6E